MLKLLCLIIYCAATALAEPECSRFHYEEKTLEKMVRLEFLVEQFKIEMDNFRKEQKDIFTEIKKDVANEVTKVRESAEADKATLASTLSDLQMMNNNLTAEVRQSVETDKATLARALSELQMVNNNLTAEVRQSVEADRATLARALSDLQMVNNNLTAQATKAIEHFQDAQKRVSFSAKTVESKSSSTGDVIIFSETVQDIDGAYNNKSGKFVVPVPGTYVFTSHLCCHNGHLIYFSIRNNGDVVARSSVFNSHNCNTLETHINVKTGHEVYVTYEISGYQIFPDDITRWNTFSGRLIYDMP